jgi:DNA-directed RNA polymerase subunit K/omega
MINFKKVVAPLNTETQDMRDLKSKTGNIYESINIIGKRANQINIELKDEVKKKLAEFASYQDTLEEIVENREQTEISKFYERVPKPHMIAYQEFIEDKVYFRREEENIEE